MAKGKISASSRKPAMFGRNIRQISQTERLKVIAQKVTVGLTPSDLITDIDCEMFASKTEGPSNNERSQSPEEDLNCLRIQNDATSQTITNNQDYNGSEEIRTSEILQLQSNGFTPLGFYGSRSKNFTPKMKLFGLNSEKNLSKENEDLPMNNLCGVKRKLKSERSSKKGSKKRRTTSGTKQHKNMTNKDKLNSDVNDKDVLVDIDHKDIRSKSQKEPYELVMKTVKEIKDSHEGVVTPPSDYDSEESGIVPICRKPKSNIDVAKSVISEVESTCSETSLCSGPGKVLDGFCLQKNGNEYYFSSSSNVSPVQLTPSSESTGEEEEGIAITHHTINSHQPCTEQNERVEVTLLDCNENVSDSRSSVSLSTSSPDAAESVFTPQLSGKEDESSSSKSSPEHQASIMRYFRSLPGPKCKTKTVANGIPSSSTGHSSAENSLESKNRITLGKKKYGKKQEQMYLDLGQKDFGHVTCPTCGMVYTRAQPDDEAAHIRHHKSFVNGLKFTGWKNECVVKEYHDGRVIMVGPDDPRLHLKKIEEVRKVVDSELGFVADVPYRRSGAKIFLFITRKKVIGCAVAIQIDQGYPVLPSPGESSTPEKQIAAWCCSTTPQSAQCGISRIWVHSQYRRKKVATRLLDCVRTNFIYGCIIPRELVAFSDPTPDGKRLANSYAGTSQFLVFR